MEEGEKGQTDVPALLIALQIAPPISENIGYLSVNIRKKKKKKALIQTRVSC